MNLVDLFLISIILLSAAFGYYRGFVSGLLDILRWIISLFLAFALYHPASRFFEAIFGWTQVWTKPLAFLLVLFGFSFLLQYLSGFLIKKLPKDFRKDNLNRALGVLPGFISGLILTIFIAAALFSMPFSGGFQDSLNESKLAEPLAIYSDGIETALAPIFEEAITETLTHRLTTYPGSDETVELPFKIKEFRERPDLEAEMLALINKERAAENLAPLEADTEMRSVAVKHSADMFERGYFSHNTPEGEDPFDRMKDDKVRYRTAGENLALAPTLKIAHTGLMNSPGHRANIMRPQFGRVGIGILDGGRRGLMITQNFRN
jgi:uncharacterized protein YkwD